MLWKATQYTNFFLQLFRHLCHSALLATFLWHYLCCICFLKIYFYKHTDVTAEMALTEIGQTSENKSLLFWTAVMMQLYSGTDGVNLEAAPDLQGRVENIFKLLTYYTRTLLAVFILWFFCDQPGSKYSACLLVITTILKPLAWRRKSPVLYQRLKLGTLTLALQPSSVCCALAFSLLCLIIHVCVINTFISSISIRLSSENMSHFAILININSLNLNTD